MKQPQSDPSTAPDPSEKLHGLSEVLAAELRELRARRKANGQPPPSQNDLSGLAISGGGIRSATFSLGALQTMARLGVLHAFDYLSTVSGGGYVGGWWSAWLSRPQRRKLPGIFPGRVEDDRRVEVAGEEIEPNRERRYQPTENGPRGSDGSLSAGRDPVHHLRLFSNYLTPRRGALSGDTWRAITVFSRNLVFTWLILLPLLLLAVLAGQLYFVAQPEGPEHLLRQDVSVAEPAPPAPLAGETAAEARARVRDQAERDARAQRLAMIRARAQSVAPAPIFLLLVALGLAVAWLLSGPSTLVGKATSAVGLLLAAGAVSLVFRPLLGGGGGEFWSPGWTLAALAAVMAVAVLAHRWPARGHPGERPGRKRRHRMPPEVVRNRIVRAHGAVLVALLLVLTVLATAGFSHDLAWYLFDESSGSGPARYLKQIGGVGVLALTVVTSIFTAWKAAPAAVDAVERQGPSRASRLVFAAAPPLLMLTLLVLVSIGSLHLLRALLDEGAPEVEALRLAVLASALVGLILATYELYHDRPADSPPHYARLASQVLGVALLAALVFTALVFSREIPARHGVPLALTLVGGVIIARWVIWRRRGRTARIAGLLGGAALGTVAWLPGLNPTGALWSWFCPAMAMIGFCGAFAAAELRVRRHNQVRALALVSAVFVMLSTLLVLSLLTPTEGVQRVGAVISLIAVVAAWVVGLGWMADPNQLSLHAFYKARLTRAYLGASNCDRGTREITEAAEGDDLPLSRLRNCQRGGPYHLVNTTLNLVGGGDLATGQRSADSFLLSKHFCGSVRTGYRVTRKYMSDTLRLGTAMAISGAAASPNMGSKTPSAALAMLLTLFNVRLGYWAPTPGRERWKAEQARLWPFYTLREFLSQTTDLSSFCYLSDGGHYENTALHSLVARGCQNIVVIDCGADPQPCFEDIGNAIRRCRIDFGTEIDLKCDGFLPGEGKFPSAHYALGEITYAGEHLEWLGKIWGEPAPQSRRGSIVWIKPALTHTEEPADVRQFGIQNSDFPQQTTADQWFGESQFESYRKLGEQSALALFGSLRNRDEPLTPAELGEFLGHARRAGQVVRVPAIAG